jgi:hypothetical protein
LIKFCVICELISEKDGKSEVIESRGVDLYKKIGPLSTSVGEEVINNYPNGREETRFDYMINGKSGLDISELHSFDGMELSSFLGGRPSSFDIAASSVYLPSSLQLQRLNSFETFENNTSETVVTKEELNSSLDSSSQYRNLDLLSSSIAIVDEIETMKSYDFSRFNSMTNEIEKQFVMNCELDIFNGHSKVNSIDVESIDSLPTAKKRRGSEQVHSNISGEDELIYNNSDINEEMRITNINNSKPGLEPNNEQFDDMLMKRNSQVLILNLFYTLLN